VLVYEDEVTKILLLKSSVSATLTSFTFRELKLPLQGFVAYSSKSSAW
jgi:hypothetical protein